MNVMEPALAPNIQLSDGVIREAGSNKLSLIGLFHNFNAARFPFQTVPFFVTVAMANLRGKLERFKIVVRVEDKSGLVAGNSALEIGTTADLKSSDVLQVPIPIACNFPSPGAYNVVVLVQTEIIGSRGLYVTPVTSAPPLPPPLE